MSELFKKKSNRLRAVPERDSARGAFISRAARAASPTRAAAVDPPPPPFAGSAGGSLAAAAGFLRKTVRLFLERGLLYFFRSVFFGLVI